MRREEHNIKFVKKKYFNESIEIQQKLIDMFNKNPKEIQLKVIKRSRTKAIDGDIFVLSPVEGIYFFGKVLNAEIDSKEKVLNVGTGEITNNSLTNKQILVFFFRCKCKEIDIKYFTPDYNNLLIPPAIVSRYYWTSGLFKTIGNEEITDEEKTLDYGFIVNDLALGQFYCKEDGTKLNHEPQIKGTMGITTSIGIARGIHKSLIFYPEILDFD